MKEGLEITQLIHVCFNIDDERTKAREVRALLHAYRDLKCEHLTVITGDYEDTETFEWYGIKGNVRFILLWKWLLNTD